MEGEERRQRQKRERDDVIPPDRLAEIEHRKESENRQGNDFLHRFELGRGINRVADPVRRNR